MFLKTIYTYVYDLTQLFAETCLRLFMSYTAEG